MIGAMLSQFCLALLWPTYLTRELHLTIGQRTQFLILLNIGSLLGYWSAGALSEKTGRRVALSVFALVGALLIPLYCLTHNYDLVMLGGFLEGFFAVGFWGVIPAYLAERFPTECARCRAWNIIQRWRGNRFFWADNTNVAGAKSRIHAGAGNCAGDGECSRHCGIVAFLGPEPKGRAFTAEN